MDAEITKQYIITLVADLKDELDVLTTNRQQAEALYGALRRYESMLGKVRFLRRLSRLAELVLDETGGVQERVHTAAGPVPMNSDEAMMVAEDLPEVSFDGIGAAPPYNVVMQQHRARDASADMMATMAAAIGPGIELVRRLLEVREREVAVREKDVGIGPGVAAEPETHPPPSEPPSPDGVIATLRQEIAQLRQSVHQAKELCVELPPLTGEQEMEHEEA